MRPRRGAAALAAALALLLPACASAPAGGAPGDPVEGGVAARPVTTLVVENRAFQDMAVFVLRGSQRIRIGMATGNRSTRLTIPASLIFGVTPLRFLADPIGGGGTPVSEEIQVREGETVTITILP